MENEPDFKPVDNILPVKKEDGFDLCCEKIERLLHKELKETVWYKKIWNYLTREQIRFWKFLFPITFGLAFAHDVLKVEFLRNNMFSLLLFVLPVVVFLILCLGLFLKLILLGNDPQKYTIGDFLRNRSGINLDRTILDEGVKNKV